MFPDNESAVGTGAKETGFVQKELPIHVSNLIYKDPDSGKSGRVKIEKLNDGASSRVIVEAKKDHAGNQKNLNFDIHIC